MAARKNTGTAGAGSARPKVVAATATAPSSSGDARDPILLLSQTFTDWLAARNCSLALTTYQAGRLFLIGRRADGSVRGSAVKIPRARFLAKRRASDRVSIARWAAV